MLCQACKQKTATIHLTEITNGQRSETHLCQECAQQQGLAVKTQIPLNELLSTLLSAQPQAEASVVEGRTTDKRCPECGMTLARFSKETLLGCPHDYKVFEKELLPLIARSHNGKTTHCGKTPSHLGQAQKTDILLRRLRQELDEAVRNEDYETAARLRDQINQHL